MMFDFVDEAYGVLKETGSPDSRSAVGVSVDGFSFGLMLAGVVCPEVDDVTESVRDEALESSCRSAEAGTPQMCRLGTL